MSVLITGAYGQVGFELKRAFLHMPNVHALGRDGINLANADNILAVLSCLKPSIILNPAAYTAVDKAESEKDLVMKINATAPGIIAKWAADNGALMVHYSTDYVFDGKKTSYYTETDIPNPLSVYGESKLRGEVAVSAAGGRHIVLRTSWVFGAHGNNFLKTMLRLAKEKNALNVVADQFGAPTSAALIASTTSAIIDQLASNSHHSGIYHLSAHGSTSWYGYARHVILSEIERGVKLSVTGETLKPIPAQDYPTAAVRPKNSRLDCTKLMDTFGITMPNWQKGVDSVLSQLSESGAG